MTIETAWLGGIGGAVAHLCVINRDNPHQPKAAAICNTRAKIQWRPATPESARCETCQNMWDSEREVIWIMPDSGKRVVIKPGGQK